MISLLRLNKLILSVIFFTAITFNSSVAEEAEEAVDIWKQQQNQEQQNNQNKSDQDLHIKKKAVDHISLEEKKPIIVSVANFQKTVDPGTEFDFTSFVKSVSRKNTALPKYIRDNWTIVVSIRNQLENGN